MQAVSFLRIESDRNVTSSLPLLVSFFPNASYQNFEIAIFFKIVQNSNYSELLWFTGKWLWVTELNYCYFHTLFTLILEFEFSYLLGNFGLRYKGCKLCKLLIVTLTLCLLWYLVYFDAFFTLMLWYFDTSFDTSMKV